jgi:hypothetical protein
LGAVNLTACEEKPDQHRSREAKKMVAQIFNLSEKNLSVYLSCISLSQRYIFVFRSRCVLGLKDEAFVLIFSLFLFFFSISFRFLFLVFRFCPSVSVNFVGGTVDIGKDAVIPGVMV